MRKYRDIITIICILVICAVIANSLLGCQSAVLQSDYDYTLLLQSDDLTVVAGDDPLYDAFDSILADPFIRELFDLYTATAKGIIIDGIPSRYGDSLSRKPVFVLGTIEPGVRRNLILHHEGKRLQVDLALALGGGTPVDFDQITIRMPAALGELMMTVMGVEPIRGEEPYPAIFEVTSPDQALWIGFGAALEAHFGRHQLDLWPNPADTALDDTANERLLRYREIPLNGFRTQYRNAEPENTPRSYQQALGTPGVVATFFYRLWTDISSTYKQSDMLWFANYDASQIRGAKILLAMRHMPRRSTPTLETFVQSYCETYPTECTQVKALFNDVVGAPAH